MLSALRSMNRKTKEPARRAWFGMTAASTASATKAASTATVTHLARVVSSSVMAMTGASSPQVP